MKTRRKLGLILILSIILVIMTISWVQADDPDGDVVIMGDNYVLKSDQKIKGNLVVYGGNVTLQEDSTVKQDVTVFGGNLTIGGNVDGDVVVWGGNVTIQSDAVVRGDVTVIGGNLTREEGADIRGKETQGWPSAPINPPSPPRVPAPHVRVTRPSGLLSGIGNMFRTLFGLIVIIVLGILVVVFIPHHTDTVAETMLKAPAQSLGSGLAALIAAPLVALVLTITVFLIPISAVVLLILGIGILFGWIAAGLLFGVKLLRALQKNEPSRIVAVAVGLPILTILSFVPCVGWLITLGLMVWSLGAVVYSLFGTRAYHEPMPPIWSRPSSPIQKPPAPRPDETGETAYDPRIDRL